MLNHELMKEEVDLLQGRVGKSIFVRHYWSPAITELRESVQGPRTAGSQTGLREPSNLLTREGKYLEGHTDIKNKGEEIIYFTSLMPVASRMRI